MQRDYVILSHIFSHFNIHLKISLIFQGIGEMHVTVPHLSFIKFGTELTAEFYAQLKFSLRAREVG